MNSKGTPKKLEKTFSTHQIKVDPAKFSVGRQRTIVIVVIPTVILGGTVPLFW